MCAPGVLPGAVLAQLVPELDRVEDLGSFDALTAGNATSLARKYDLDYLVTDRALALPLAYRAGQFRVYRLQSPTTTVASLAASVR